MLCHCPCSIVGLVRLFFERLKAYLTHEGILEPDDIPQTEEPVWILGKRYNGYEDIEIIRQDILTRLWCTYRRGFIPIGGADGLTTDKGWGCMLRCGQMVLAQALLVIHMGRDWIWEPDSKDPTYLKIVQKFEDRRTAPYSIHQIAVMGQSEGKSIGEWFGPNTVAQVLKKLTTFDDWNSVAIHVALDNMVIIDDIRNLCYSQGDGSRTAADRVWKPLLLIVPVRLGVTSVNPIYIGSLKKSFKFKQSLGVIGGKPNLALYFIGCVGDEVVYLDPHTTQKFGLVGNKETEEQIEMDKSYHCRHAARISILQMDPSVAMSFLCKTEQEFEELIEAIKTEAEDPDTPPLFYVYQERPKQWTSVQEDVETCEEALGAVSLAGRATSTSNLSSGDLEEFEFL